MSSPCSFVAIHLSTADRARRQERWLTTRSEVVGQIDPLPSRSGIPQLVFGAPRRARFQHVFFRRLAMPESAPATRRPVVLLIEAEPMLRLTMTKFLERSGYIVT